MAKHVLSIEIGTQVTKVVEVDYKKKNPHVYRAVSFATPEGVIEDGVIRDKDVLAVEFRNELAEAGMKEKSVVFSIASSKIATREVTLPNVSENKIGALVKATAQEYFPIDLTDYTLAYTLLETIKEGKQKTFKILLLAAPDDLVENYYNFAKEMGFNIEALDYFGNGSMQVLKKEIVLGYCACIQMSGNTTMINFMNEGQQLMQRTIPQGVFNIAQAMVLNEECAYNDMDSACEALCRDKLVCRSLDYKGIDEDESVVSARMTEDQWRQGENAKASRKIVTDSVGEILLSLMRVIDFFKSKYPEAEMTSLYITGMGSKILGIDDLFSNELNIPTQRMEHLVNVSFPRNFSEGLYNQTEYIAVVGAAMNPVGFKSKNQSAGGGGAEALRNAQLVFGLSVIIAAGLIIFSVMQYQSEKTRNNTLKADQESLQKVEITFKENEDIKNVASQVDNIYSSTTTQNELLNSLISQLEDNLPRTMKVSNLTCDSDSGVSMTLSSKNDISIARLIMNLKNMKMKRQDLVDKDIISEDSEFPDEIPVLADITVPSVTKSEDDMNGETTYDFSVSAKYYVMAYQLMLQQQRAEQAAAAAAAAAEKSAE